MSATIDAPPASAVNLSKRYGDAVAVDSISFELRPGRIAGLFGPNGAGKTTTLRMLLGLAEPTSGAALINGRPVCELERPWELVGAVLESNDFHPARSGRNHLRVLARLCEIDDQRVDAVLDLVGLGGAGDRLVGRYSLGMRQRLGLAGALLGRPKLLILDEPANGLDPVGVRWLRDLLRAFTDDGGTVLLSSHLLAEAAQAVDDVLIVADGQLRIDCALSDLDDDLESVYLSVAGTPAEVVR